MEAKAHVSHVRITPRKVKLVIDLIRGKKIGDAVAILRHTPKAASPIIEKLLMSAVANAEHNFQMDPEDLVISEIYADQGPTLKRIRARARGMASQIRKKTSHITVVVSDNREQEAATVDELQKKEG